MEEIKNYALINHIPIVRDRTACYLVNECSKLNPKKILEIGTAIGYSGLLMLNSCKGSLLTIEKDEKRVLEANKNFSKYNMSKRVCIKCGDALDELMVLYNDNQKFDFIFLDGPKGQYIKYFPILKKLLNKNGVLFADNVLMNGLVNNIDNVTHKNRAMVRNMKKFNTEILNDSEFKSTLYDLDDGFIVAVKIK